MQTATFDPFGNVTSTTTSDWGTQTLQTDAATNRLSAAGYDPGGTGNVISWGTFTHGYDKLSRLQTVTATGVNRTYLYSADGERISDRDNQTGTTTLTIRDLGGKVLRVFVNGTRTKDYVWGNGVLLAAVEAPSTKRHFQLDHLGSPRLITNTSAAKVAAHTYYPFGLEVPGGTADGERMKFTGHEREPYNHDSMHARHYNPTTLRFLTPDLLRGDVHRPQSFNLFAYVGGNPVNYVDPFGFGDEEPADLPPDILPPSTLTFWGEVEVTAGTGWLPWLTLRALLWSASREGVGGPPEMGVPRRGDESGRCVPTRLPPTLHENWPPDLFVDALRAGLTGSAGYRLIVYPRIGTSALAAVRGEIAAQAAIAAAGGTPELVATGFLGTGLGLGSAAFMVAGSATAGWTLGTGLREELIPENANRWYGDRLKTAADFWGVTPGIESCQDSWHSVWH